ncbi:KIAA1217 isoform 16, partial [Pongo abelii]
MEENESQKREPCLPYSADRRQMQEQGKGNLHVTSPEDAECRRTKERLSNGNSRGSVSKSSRNIPRRHTLGGPRSSKEILGMQTSEMDRKREAFLEHLKQKYPHHASAIMGHQERLRDQALKGMLISLQAELDIQRQGAPNCLTVLNHPVWVTRSSIYQRRLLILWKPCLRGMLQPLFPEA